MLTREIYEKGQLVIPKSIRDMLGFDVGTAVSFFVDGNRLIIEKKRSIAGEFAKMAASGNNKKIQYVDGTGYEEQLNARMKRVGHA